jgi:hypothetical protein
MNRCHSYHGIIIELQRSAVFINNVLRLVWNHRSKKIYVSVKHECKQQEANPVSLCLIEATHLTLTMEASRVRSAVTTNTTQATTGIGRSPAREAIRPTICLLRFSRSERVLYQAMSASSTCWPKRPQSRFPLESSRITSTLVRIPGGGAVD